MRQPADVPGSDGDLTWSEVADALWLAAVRGPDSGTTAPGESPSSPASLGDTPERREPAGEPSTPVAPDDTVETFRDAREIATAPAATSSVRMGAQLPTASIARALRPLALQVPSHRLSVLDEERVAVRAAETGVWLPVLRPATTRLLDAVLLVDTSASMALWRETAIRFHTLLTRLGAFHDVRLAWVDTDQERPTSYSTSRRAARRALADLVDPSGRRVIFVLTNGDGRAWRQDMVVDWLPRLGVHGPLVVLNVLPRRLWRMRTQRVWLAAASPATANRRLRWQPVWPPDEARGDELPVPVLELAGPWLSRWAGLLTATGPVTVELPALLVGDRTEEVADLTTGPVAEELPVEDLVHRFHVTASPPAFRLASLLAALPVTLATMSVVRDEMVPDATLTHMAEVLSSGLLRPVTGDPDREYEFLAGARAELLTGLRRAETEQVVRVAVTRFRSAAPALHLLREALKSPSSTALPEKTEARELERAVMRALSGPYLRRARRLEDRSEADWSMSDPRTMSSPESVSFGDDVEASGGRSDGQNWTSPRDELFVSREEVETVRALLDDEDGGPVVLLGEPGVGKTELAHEYAHRFGGDYDRVWWLPAHEPASVVAAYRELALQYEVVPRGAGGQAAVTAARLLLAARSEAGRSLVIFDDAGAAAGLEGYLPEGGDIMVTSTDRDWARLARVVEIGRFTPEQSRDLLRAQGVEADETAALCEALGQLPAAVRHVGHRLTSGTTPVPEYLRQVAADGPYGPALADLGSGARILLDFCAVLGPGALSDEWFSVLPEAPGLPGVPQDRTARQLLWDELTRAGLVGTDDKGVVLPGPVRAAVLAVLDDTAGNRLREVARVLLTAAMAAGIAVAELIPHIRATAVGESDAASARRLVIDAVAGLVETGDPDNARELADGAVDSWTAWLGAGHPDTRAVVARLGVALRVIGEKQEALRLHQSDEAAAVHLVRTLRETGAVDAAVDLGRTVGDRVRGDLAVAAELAASLRMAAVLCGIDGLDEAHRLQQEVVSGVRMRLGERHPETLMAVTDVALTTCLLGGDRGATTRDVESRLRESVGPAHPFTLACGAVVASELYNVGEYAAALRRDRSLVTRSSAAWGAEHPTTLALRMNLALDEQAVGQAGDIDEVLACCTCVLGVDHPVTGLATIGVRAWHDPDPPAWLRYLSVNSLSPK